jgi:hypothetical protein
MSIKVRCRLSGFLAVRLFVEKISRYEMKLKTVSAVTGVQTYETKLQRHNI